MNESTIRQRLREALGESPYPPYLTSRVTAGLSRPAEKKQRNLSVTMESLSRIRTQLPAANPANGSRSSRPRTVDTRGGFRWPR